MYSILRQGELKDLPQLLNLAKSFPLCSLPEDKTRLIDIIEQSLSSFNKKTINGNQRYLFVIEVNGKIIGSSQILSHQKEESPYFFLNEKVTPPLLQLMTTQKNHTQLGGLILNAKYRASVKKWGRQIGLFRFLYIAENPKLFTNTIEVSLTAPLEESNTSSKFWKLMNFSDLPKAYPKALLLYKENPSRFFSLFPKTKSVSLKDSTKEIKNSLKRVHPATFPAYKGFLELGFKKTNRHHVLDGGLFLEGEKKNLPILKQSKKVFLKQSLPEKKDLYLWGQKTSNGFSGGLIAGEIKGTTLLLKTLPSETISSEVRIIPFYPARV